MTGISAEIFSTASSNASISPIASSDLGEVAASGEKLAGGDTGTLGDCEDGSSTDKPGDGLERGVGWVVGSSKGDGSRKTAGGVTPSTTASSSAS